MHGNLARYAVAMTLMLAITVSTADAQSGKPLRKCPPDAVVSGTVCMDKYEASVWRVPDGSGANASLVRKIQRGTVSGWDELDAAGAVNLGVGQDDYGSCGDNGQGCTDVYAVSLPGLLPSARLTWFQAQQACKNARKRLPSNAEWQAAVVGTPDPGPGPYSRSECNVTDTWLRGNGESSACVSADGAFDMVGNLNEWVADWVPRSTTCGQWGPTGDTQCLGGSATDGPPGALVRGGSFDGSGGSGDNSAAGPLSVLGTFGPFQSGTELGFRCAR